MSLELKIINVLNFLLSNFKYIIGVIIVLYLLYDANKTSKMEKLLVKIQNEKNITKTKEFSKRTKNILTKMIIDDVNQKIHYISINRNKLKCYEAREIEYKDIEGIVLIENEEYTKILSIEDIFEFRDPTEILHKVGFRLSVNDIKNPLVEMIFDNSKKSMSECTVFQVHELIAAIRMIMNKVNVE